MFGRAGEAEFSDAVATRADVATLRRKVVATVDAGIAEDAVDATAWLTDGRRVHIAIEHASGSMHRPLSDAALDAKFHDLADPVLGAARCDELIQACRASASAPDLRRLAALAQP
jgi:2-methylcitrate dehydratase PrpD